MTIIQSPATYNFAGNIPDLIVDTTEQLSFTLSRGGTQIVAETYTPAQNDRIVINLRNLLELLVEVPGYEEVATPIAQYTYTRNALPHSAPLALRGTRRLRLQGEGVFHGRNLCCYFTVDDVRRQHLYDGCFVWHDSG